MELDGLRPGPSVLQVTTANPGETSQSTRVSKSVRVDPADGQTLDIREIPAAGGVSGIVNFEGNPSATPGVLIFLRDASKGTLFRAAVDLAGNFSFADELEPGLYEVTSARPGGLQLRSVSASGAKVTGNKIEIRNGSDVRLILTLARGVNAHVKGIVEQRRQAGAGVDGRTGSTGSSGTHGVPAGSERQRWIVFDGSGAAGKLHRGCCQGLGPRVGQARSDSRISRERNASRGGGWRRT